MTIPLVVQGLVETKDGEVFGLDTCKGSAWLEVNDSFRYELIGVKKGYTARKETKKGGDYWYGYRKVAGNLHKRYIGKTSELTVAKLEEIAEALDILQQSRVTKTVTETVTESKLRIELGNLKAENEALRQELAKTNQKYLTLLNDSANKAKELQSPLETVQTRWLSLPELKAVRAENQWLHTQLSDSAIEKESLEQNLVEVRSQLETERADREEIEAELSELKQNSAPAATFSEKSTPDAATILSQLRAKRKKSPVSLADIESVLEIIEES